MVEKRARSIGEYAHVRKWQEGTLLNSKQLFGVTVRLPDTIIFLSTLTSVIFFCMVVKFILLIAFTLLIKVIFLAMRYFQALDCNIRK